MKLLGYDGNPRLLVKKEVEKFDLRLMVEELSMDREAEERYEEWIEDFYWSSSWEGS